MSDDKSMRRAAFSRAVSAFDMAVVSVKQAKAMCPYDLAAHSLADIAIKALESAAFAADKGTING